MSRWTSFWAAVGLMASVLLLQLALEHPPGTSEEVAAWVQALGSIGAIVAATLIARDSARTSRQIALEMQNREVAGRLEVAVHVASQARDLREILGNRLAGSSETQLGANDFDNVTAAIAALPFAELRSGRLVTNLMALQRVVRMLGSISDHHERVVANAPGADNSKIIEEFTRRSAALDRIYGEVEKASAEALGRLTDSHNTGVR